MYRKLAESVELFSRGIATSARPEDRVLASSYLAALAPVLAQAALGDDVLQDLPGIERLFGSTSLIDDVPFEEAFKKWRGFRQEYETFRGSPRKFNLDDLHDAILTIATVDVGAKLVILSFDPIQWEGAPERVELVARDWKMFSCPKDDPWGLAKYWRVNEARGPHEIGLGLHRLEIEMQSGDTIEIDAVSMERIDVRGSAS